MTDWGQSIDAYEQSVQVSPFSSKFDAFLKGTYKLTADEKAGFELFNGKGNCNSCHLDGRGTTLKSDQTDTSAAATANPHHTLRARKRRAECRTLLATGRRHPSGRGNHRTGEHRPKAETEYAKTSGKWTMEFMNIGGSVLRSSRVGLGTWAMGGWMWGGTDEDESIRTIMPLLIKVSP